MSPSAVSAPGEAAERAPAVEPTAAAAAFERWCEVARQFLAENGSPARALAFERFARRGFPTHRDEAWRFTPPAAIVRRLGRPAQPAAPDGATLREARAAVARGAMPGAAVAVFVDGFFAPAISSLADLPPGVEVGGLAARAPELLDPPPRAEREDRHGFADLNRVLCRDGALVRLAPRVVLERPIQLVFLTTGAGAATGAAPPVAFPRNWIELGEGAQATVVERHETLGAGEAASIAWTSVRVADRAVLDHYRLEKDGSETAHVAVQQAWVGRSAAFSSHAFSLGAAIARQDVECFLEGEGGEAILNGLYLVTGARHADTHMRVEHRAPHCASHELYKGILDGKARAVFNGRIFVHQGAQKTDAKQTNRNLILSPEALVATNPQLEIFADDVRCTHGSTVGQLDQTAIFYLRSRGIGEAAAKSLLTYAFASDVVERVKPEALRRELEEHLFAWLPMGEVVRDAV